MAELAGIAGGVIIVGASRSTGVGSASIGAKHCHFDVIYFHKNGNMKEQEVVHALAALAQVNRLRVFRHLVMAGPSGATPGQISESLSLPNATLSFHLRELSSARLIQAQREGRNLIYRAQFKQMNELLGYLTENCCQGAADCLDSSGVSCTG